MDDPPPGSGNLSPSKPLRHRIATGIGFNVLLVVVVLMIGGWLRWDRASFDGLTFDEQWHVELSTGRGSPHLTLPTGRLIEAAPAVTSTRGAAPIWAVWSHLSAVAHPPLFVTMLHAWRAMFGESDLAAKSLSIVCSLIAIALLYDAVRALSGQSIALWAALMFAVAPVQIYLGQQVRGYAMAQMWACGALAAMARIERVGASRGRIVGLAICSTALPLTHYFGLAGDLALGAFALVRLRGFAGRRALGALVIAALVFLSTWGPFIPEQRRTVSQLANPWLHEQMPAARHAMLTLGRAAAVPVRQIAEPIIWSYEWPLIAGALVLLGAAVMLFFRRRSGLLLWVLWLAGTLGFIMAFDLATNANLLTHTRYTALAAPATMALIAAIGGTIPRTSALRHIVPATAVLYALVLWPSAYGRFDERDEPEWRNLGATLRQHARPDDIFIFASGRQPPWYHEILYLGAAHYDPQGFPRAIVRLPGAGSRELSKQLSGRSAWLISGPLDRPVEQFLPGAQATEQYELPHLALLTRVTFPRSAEGP